MDPVDLVVVKYSTAMNYDTALNPTKMTIESVPRLGHSDWLDSFQVNVLDSFKTIMIAIEYTDPETGEGSLHACPTYDTDTDILYELATTLSTLVSSIAPRLSNARYPDGTSRPLTPRPSTIFPKAGTRSYRGENLGFDYVGCFEMLCLPVYRGLRQS